MPTEAQLHVTGSARLAMVLAATGGFVDAFIYVRVTPVFVANMSGNLIRLGIASGGKNWISAAASAVALAGFLVGVFISTTYLDVRLRAGRRPVPTTLLMVEAALLVVVAVTVTAAGARYSSSIHGIDYIVVVFGSVSMGMQAVGLRRVGEVAVSTTYGTGAVVRIGEKLALALRRSARPGDHRRRVTITVLGGVLVSYVAGASLAAALQSYRDLVFLPPLVLMAAACSSHRPAQRLSGHSSGHQAHGSVPAER